MRLTRLVMEGFRSYRDPVEVRFEPGANVFLGPNEAGKTGILLAVQAALYPPRLASDRELLLSDGSEVCRVGLEYTLSDGRVFRVDRDLVAHRGSIAELRATGPHILATAVGDVAQVIREHTGCDEALFKATLLVRHEGVEVGVADDLARSLSERIEVLVSGSPGGTSAAKAVRVLEDRVKGLSGPRAGEIARGEQALREAESELASARSKSRRLEDGRPRLDELTRRAAELEAELGNVSAVLERAHRAAAMDRRRAELDARRREIDRTLDAQARLAEMEAQVANARRRRWPLAVAAAFGSAGLLALGLGWPWPGAAGIGLATLLALWSLLASPRSGEVPRSGGGAVARSGEVPRSGGGAVQSDSTELLALRAQLGRDLEEIEPQTLMPAAELARLEMRHEQLPNLIKAATEARIRSEVELQQLEESGPPLPELEDEAAVARAAVERLKFKLDAMRLAHEELRAAIQEIRQGVGPRLAEEASRVLAAVAPGYAVALDGGAGLGFVPAESSGEPVTGREMSDGTADQYYFAVRLALAGVLLGELTPPLLLDDPFRYADAGRRESLHAVLEEIARERQVLYFTVEDPAPLAVTHRLPVLAGRAAVE